MDFQDDEVERAKHFQRAVVQETLVRLMAKGAEAAGIIGQLCTRLRDHIQSVARTLKPVAKAACMEVDHGCQMIQMLVGIAPPDQKVMSSLMSNKVGAKMNFKLGILQNPYWCDLEKKCQGLASALMSLKPEVDKAEAEASCMPLDDLVGRVVPRLPIWRDSLRPGAC